MIFIKEMWFLQKKKCGKFVLFRLFRFLSEVLEIKINDLHQIANTETLCCYNFNNKTKYG